MALSIKKIKLPHFHTASHKQPAEIEQEISKGRVHHQSESAGAPGQ